MKLWPSTPCCGTATTGETSAMEVARGLPPRLIRAKQIHHVNGLSRWWHWSDQVIAEENWPKAQGVGEMLGEMPA